MPCDSNTEEATAKPIRTSQAAGMTKKLEIHMLSSPRIHNLHMGADNSQGATMTSMAKAKQRVVATVS